MYRNTYTLYNSKKAVEDLDTNRYNPYRATIFPYGVYTGAILPVDDYICGQAVPRDTSSHYIIDRERVQHPDKFSRFGYARNFYGYTVGNWTNRYQTSQVCQALDPFAPPPDMAPPEFYKAPNVGPFSDRAAAYEGSLAARLDINPGPLLVPDGPPCILAEIERTQRSP